MDIQIIDKPLTLDVYGFSGIATDKDYARTAFNLMDKMWKIVKSNNLPNKGLNIWIYEPGEKVFAGVELTSSPTKDVGLEHKNYELACYAYYKHVGPYNLIKTKGQNMKAELAKRGLAITSPYIEIYGHWIQDESALETELIMAIAKK
jgi:hypothetical protein